MPSTRSRSNKCYICQLVISSVDFDFRSSNKTPTEKKPSRVNAFLTDIFERIAGEGARLVGMSDGNTLGSCEIQTAVELVLPGDRTKHAVSESRKAAAKLNSHSE